MIFIKLDNLDTVEKLCKICNKYKEEMYVDIIHGRYIVDGCSILGVTSMMNNIIKVVPSSDNNLILNNFFEEIQKIGAYKIENNED